MTTRRVIDITAVALVVGIALAAGFVRDFSGDFHWHVVLGNEVLDRVRVYTHDLHSHTFQGEPMFNSSWLGDVLLALGFRAGEYAGCYLLRALALAALAGCLIVEAHRRGVALTTAAALVAFLLGQCLFLFYLRPETFAFALLAGTLLALGTHERTGSRRPLIIALGLILLWPNIHGSVGIGLLAIGLYSAQWVLREWFIGDRDRRELATGLALPFVAFGLACVNPEGIRLPLAFDILSDVWIATVFEWSPLRLENASAMLQVAGLVILLTTVGGLAICRKTSGWHAVLVIVLALLTFRYRRFATYALIAAVPLVATNLAILGEELHQRSRVWLRVGTALTALTAVWVLGVLFLDRELHREVGTGLDPGAYPESACEFANEVGVTGPLLNHYDFGSYLMFCLDADQKVFVDQRAWSLYSEEFFERYQRAKQFPEELRSLADDYQISWAFIAYDLLAIRMAAEPATWRLVYFDDRVLIYLRVDQPGNRRIIREHGFRFLDPTRLLNLVDIPPHAIAPARAELDRQAKRCLRCRRTRLARAALAIAARDDAEFQQTIDELLAEGESPEIAFLSGKHALVNGDPATALVFFDRFEALGGDPRVAEKLRSQARSGRR